MLGVIAGGFPDAEVDIFGLKQLGIFALAEKSLQAFCQRVGVVYAGSIKVDKSELGNVPGLSKNRLAQQAGRQLAKTGEINHPMLQMFKYLKVPSWLYNGLQLIYCIAQKGLSLVKPRILCSNGKSACTIAKNLTTRSEPS